MEQGRAAVDGCVDIGEHRRLGYQLGIQLAQQPHGAVTVYPEVVDPLGLLKHLPAMQLHLSLGALLCQIGKL